MGKRLLLIGGSVPGQLPDSYARGFDAPTALEAFVSNQIARISRSAAWRATATCRRASGPRLWQQGAASDGCRRPQRQPAAVMVVRAPIWTRRPCGSSDGSSACVLTLTSRTTVIAVCPLTRADVCPAPELIDVTERVHEGRTWEPALAERLQSDE